MPVTSAFVYYVGNTAYDLRKVSQVWVANGGFDVSVRFIDDEKTFVTFNKVAFEAAWQAALNAGGGGGGANWGAIGGDILNQADLQAQFDTCVLVNPATQARNTITPTADVVGLTVHGVPAGTANLQEWEDGTGTTKLAVEDDGTVRVGTTPFITQDSGTGALKLGQGAIDTIHVIGGSASVNTPADGATAFLVKTETAAGTGIQILETAAQTANPFAVRDSGNTIINAIAADGGISTIRGLAGYIWPTAHALGGLRNDGTGVLSWQDYRVGNTLFVDVVTGNDATGTRGDPDRPFLTIKAAVDSPDRVSGDRICVRPGNHNITVGITVSNALRIDLEAGSFVNIATGITGFTLNAGSSFRAKGNGGFGGPGTLYVTTASIFVYIDVMTFAGAQDTGTYFVNHPQGLLTLKVQGVASLSGAAGGGLVSSGATTDIEIGQLSNVTTTALPALNLTGTVDVTIGKVFQASTVTEFIRLNASGGGVIRVGSMTNSGKALVRSTGGDLVTVVVDGTTYSTATVDPTIINDGGNLKVTLAKLNPGVVGHPGNVRMSAGTTIVDGGVYASPTTATATIEATGGRLVITPDTEISGGDYCVKITGGASHEIAGKLSGGGTGALYIDGLTVNAYSLRAVGLITGTAGGILRCTLPCSTTVAPTVITTQGYSLPVFAMT